MNKENILQNKNMRLFFGYVFFAGLAALADIGLLFLLTNFFGVWYFYSAIFAYIAGMLVNYLLNRRLNFRNKSRQVARQFGVFAMVAVAGLALNQAVLYLLVEYAGLWYMFSKTIAVFIVMFWSFYGHKKLTFNIFK